jgi:hypothetical protein
MVIAAVAASTGDFETTPDIWTWVARTLTVEGTLNIAGLVLLVVLFSRDLILTRGQHQRRVADMETAHGKLLAEINRAHAAELAAEKQRYADMFAEKSERYSEMRDSRDYYRDARLAEQTKVQTLTSELVESNKGLRVAARALGALEQAVPTGET